MQDSENKAKKKKARPGFTDKRFWIRDEHMEAVESYAAILGGKKLIKGYTWSDALEEIIETHPKVKRLIK